VNGGLRSLAARLLIAFGVATAGLIGLDLVVRRQDGEAATLPPRPPEQALPDQVALRAASGLILLSSRLAALEPALAPVVQVLTDGGLALRRATPLARGPGGDAEAATRGAAIILPVPSLARLDPRARAALVEVIGQLVVERPVPATRFRTVDFALPTAELERLLRWVP